jgi:DNA repair protein RadC
MPTTIARSDGVGQLAIRELAYADRPMYRITHHGPVALSEAELVALITGTPDLGVAYRLLAETGGLRGLFTSKPNDLRGKVKGVGPTAIARLNAAFELSRRLLYLGIEDRPQIRSPANLAPLLMREMSELDQENLRVACLDTKNRVQTITTLYVGSLNTAVVRVGEVFKEALRRNSSAIILAHNHPSGEVEASPEDLALTRQIVEAGKLLDVLVLDHLIIGKGRFLSMAEFGFAGLGFTS